MVMELKFKEGVFGFVYDSQYGEVKKVFRKPLNETEKMLVWDLVDEYDGVFFDVETVSEVFEVNEDLLSCDSEGLNRVLEFVK
jgi:hypothetical protein